MQTGTLVATLYAHSGTYGSTGVPTGSALATSASIKCKLNRTSYALVTFTFDGTYNLIAGTYYFICLEILAALMNTILCG